VRRRIDDEEAAPPMFIWEIAYIMLGFALLIFLMRQQGN
jgi:hypothetical protein